MVFSRKNTLKYDISGIAEKDYIHPRKYGISSERKIKDDKISFLHKKVPMIFIKVFSYIALQWKKTTITTTKKRNRIYRIEIWLSL